MCTAAATTGPTENIKNLQKTHKPAVHTSSAYPWRYQIQLTVVCEGHVMVSLPVRGLLGSVGLKEMAMLVAFLAGTRSEGLTLKDGLSTLQVLRGKREGQVHGCVVSESECGLLQAHNIQHSRAFDMQKLSHFSINLAKQSLAL